MSTWLDDSWFEGAYQALLDTLKVDARLRRDMIQFLFDEGFWDQEKLTWPAAEARWNACLNRTKADAAFKIGELWALMKRFNQHQFFLAMAHDLGYEVRRKSTEERRQYLQQAMVEAVDRMAAMVESMQGELSRIQVDEVEVTRAMFYPGERPKFSRADATP